MPVLRRNETEFGETTYWCGFASSQTMRIPRWPIVLLLVGTISTVAGAQLTIAQISDIHIGEKHAPHAFDNLRKTVDMVNERHPDAVIVSGDIGENHPRDWDTA